MTMIKTKSMVIITKMMSIVLKSKKKDLTQQFLANTRKDSKLMLQ